MYDWACAIISFKAMYYYLLRWATKWLNYSHGVRVNHVMHNDRNTVVYPDDMFALIVFAILLSPPIVVFVGSELFNVSDSVAWVLLAIVGTDMLIGCVLSVVMYFRKRRKS